MIARPPTPEQLAEFPELAALEVLDAALGVAVSALQAVHPLVATSGFASEPPGPTALASLADSIAVQADALQTMLAHYRDCVAHLEEFSEIQRSFARATVSEPDDDNDIPF